jgi:hypothetical protein
MHQQQGLQQAGFRRGPSVGIGTLVIAMAMAFVAGALVFALASRSSATVPPAAVTATGPGPAVAQARPGAGAIASVGATPLGATALTRERFVDDFAVMPAGGVGSQSRELLVDDFIPER